MKKTFALIALSILIGNVYAQQAVTKIKLAGFNVNLVASDTFSYLYDKDKSTSEELKGNQLVLKAVSVSVGGERSSVTINYANIESLELENCNLILQTPLKLNKLKMKLDKASIVNIQLDVKQLEVEIKGESKMDLAGAAKSLKIKMDGASTLNTYNLTTTDFSLTAKSKSVAHLELQTKQAVLEATSKSNMRLTGGAKSFKAKVSNQSNIDASEMEVEKADIRSKAGCDIKVHAKTLKSHVNM